MDLDQRRETMIVLMCQHMSTLYENFGLEAAIVLFRKFHSSSWTEEELQNFFPISNAKEIHQELVEIVVTGALETDLELQLDKIAASN